MTGKLNINTSEGGSVLYSGIQPSKGAQQGALGANKVTTNPSPQAAQAANKTMVASKAPFSMAEEFRQFIKKISDTFGDKPVGSVSVKAALQELVKKIRENIKEIHKLPLGEQGELGKDDVDAKLMHQLGVNQEKLSDWFVKGSYKDVAKFMTEVSEKCEHLFPENKIIKEAWANLERHILVQREITGSTNKRVKEPRLRRDSKPIADKLSDQAAEILLNAPERAFGDAQDNREIRMNQRGSVQHLLGQAQAKFEGAMDQFAFNPKNQVQQNLYNELLVRMSKVPKENLSEIEKALNLVIKAAENLLAGVKGEDIKVLKDFIREINASKNQVESAQVKEQANQKEELAQEKANQKKEMVKKKIEEEDFMNNLLNERDERLRSDDL